MLVLLTLAVLGLSSDALSLNPAERVALPYRYSLVRWEAGNLLSKWIHRMGTVLPWSHRSEADRRSDVEEYFRLGADINKLRGELRRAAAQTDQDAAASFERLEADLARLKADRKKLRDRAEEVLEATISSVLADEGVSSWGGFTFPPVDVRLSEPPRLLVTSPRDRIERTHDVLLEPDVSLQIREEMERTLQDDWNLSGLVVGIGGVGTYPAAIVNTFSLNSTVRIASHEWLHNYLFFQPLGRYMFSSSEMRTLNETFADIAGRELGDRVFQMLGRNPGQPSPAGSRGSAEVPLLNGDDDAFDFDVEMRKTRRRVDDLLAGGSVEEAESYMEERRKVFVANGFNIRKLNQAYFAFHGTYAESPTSVSPIGDQLHQLRDRMPDLGTFIGKVSGMSSYDKFLETLQRLKASDR